MERDELIGRLLSVQDIVAAAEQQFAQNDDHHRYYGDCHAAIQEAADRITSLERALTEETGWLIEDRSPGDHSLYMKLGDDPIQCVDGNERRGRIFGKFLSPLGFTKVAGEALRFARKEDAEAFVRVFKRFMLAPEVTEHSWPALSTTRQGRYRSDRRTWG